MLHPDLKKRFGLAIKNWRAKSDISQEELAWRAGLHRSYVADIERGVRNVSLQSIEKLANALKVSLSVLFQPLGDQPSAVESSPEGAGYRGRNRSENHPKLILLNLKLPKVDGMEVLRRIKSDARTRAIPVIILTASRKSREIPKSKRLGAEFHIVKPVNFHRFCAVTPRLSCYWRLFRSNARSVSRKK